MDLYLEFSYTSPSDHFHEAKRDLINLMAEEIRSKRGIVELRVRVAEFENYAVAALEKRNEALAREIAEKIVNLEKDLELRETSAKIYFDQVGRLKAVVRKMERLQYTQGDNLQYALDRMSAAAELIDDDWELRQKMPAAGIGPKAFAGQKVLERIRLSR